MSSDLPIAVDGRTVFFAPAQFLRPKEAARSLGMAVELFERCAKHYRKKPDVRQHRITLWSPTQLALLANAIRLGGIPPSKKTNMNKEP